MRNFVTSTTTTTTTTTTTMIVIIIRPPSTWRPSPRPGRMFIRLPVQRPAAAAPLRVDVCLFVPVCVLVMLHVFIW